MAELKTRKTGASVAAFLRAVPGEKRRKDAQVVLKMMKKITGLDPEMWGPSIVGFGSVHYVYASGHEGDMGLTGFSPRKAAITIYIVQGFGRYGALMAKLGKFKTGKSCLYLNSLADVDLDVLAELIRESVAHMRKTYV